MTFYNNDTYKGQEGPAQWAFLIWSSEDLVELTCETIWAWCHMYFLRELTIQPVFKFIHIILQNILLVLKNPFYFKYYCPFYHYFVYLCFCLFSLDQVSYIFLLVWAILLIFSKTKYFHLLSFLVFLSSNSLISVPSLVFVFLLVLSFARYQ